MELGSSTVTAAAHGTMSHITALSQHCSAGAPHPCLPPRAPQHHALPDGSSAHECAPPVQTAAKEALARTSTGTLELCTGAQGSNVELLLPSPSSPDAPEPVHMNTHCCELLQPLHSSVHGKLRRCGARALLLHRLPASRHMHGAHPSRASDSELWKCASVPAPGGTPVLHLGGVHAFSFARHSRA